MEKRPPILCDKKDCTGCATCVQICPQSAINMVKDEKGFLYPQIDPTKCVGCLLCEKRCPINEPERTTNPSPTVYACWHKNMDIRLKSSSGGVFSAIAEYILKNDGIVWGAAYSKDLILTYQYVENIKDLDKLRRSKYVQAEVNDSFKLIKEQLKAGRKVLFTGTSCHIRGLYSYLPKKLQENLVTIDFICHGVPSPSVFRKYVNWLEKKYNDKLVDFNFRDKQYGWDNGVLTIGYFQHKGKKIFMNDENSYFYGMLHDMFIRPCCHECQSNGLQRESDFTIADFWGIGRKNKFEHEHERNYGISLLALNSEKAHKIYETGLKNSIVSVQRSQQEAYEGNWNYRFSAKRNSKTPIFWEQFQRTNNWEDLLSFFQPTFSEKCKLFIKRYGGPTIANKLRRILGK
ncbi:MAG: Coenzyme F420 hydrogenase/dehydrogenase, beta subunit C-terminal domain [Candidatus Phocaeicola faecipullorum]|nr:Coenzyme F420 hydrogenase/dehydrogenase, beta subunit C-terminal domain [Candidatus Phocaeicola faecipullorum]